MFTQATTEEWSDMYRQTVTASFFQSPEWSHLWCEYAGSRFEPAPLRVQLASGRTALFPLTRQRLRGGAGFLWHGAPAGTYGGLLEGDGIMPDPEELAHLLQSLFEHCGSLVFRPFPLIADYDVVTRASSTHGFSEDTARKITGISVTPDRTWLLDCSSGFDAIRDRWAAGSGAMLRKIDKAKNSGVVVRKAVSMEDVAAYHQLYIDSLERWDPPPVHIYPETFLRMLAGISSESRSMWLAEYKGEIIAGAIVLTGRNHCDYWHGVMSPRYSKLRPVNLMVSSIIESCCHAGIRWFDFNPSIGLEGVEKFKKSFGTFSVPCPVLRRETLMARTVMTAGRIARRIKKAGVR